MTEELSEWMDRQLRLRGWSERTAADYCGVSQTTIQRARGKVPERTLSWDAAYALAKGFRVDPMAMFIMAGLMEREPEQTWNERQLTKMFRQLPSEHQANLMFFCEYLFTQRANLFPKLDDLEDDHLPESD